MASTKHRKLVLGEGTTQVASLGEVAGDELIDLVIADGVVEIEQFAFRFCGRIASVAFPNTLQTIGMYAFDECSNLGSIIFSNSITKIGMHAFSASCIENVVLPSGLKEVDAWLFAQCANLKSVGLPDGLERICQQAFRGCRALSQVVLPESLVSIGDFAFKGCRKLVSMKIPVGVKAIGEEAVPQPRKPVGVWSEEERKAHLKRITEKRERILSAIQKDTAIPIGRFPEKVQKLARECGLTAEDVVTYKHTDSYVMCCPCAMQFPALTRVAVRVPKSALGTGESDCIVVYLDEDRNKDWAVIPVCADNGSVGVYASLSETKSTRFGKLFSLVSRVRSTYK